MAQHYADHRPLPTRVDCTRCGASWHECRRALTGAGCCQTCNRGMGGTHPEITITYSADSGSAMNHADTFDANREVKEA